MSAEKEPERALCAFGQGGAAIVMQASGPLLESDIEQIGSGQLDDLGLGSEGEAGELTADFVGLLIWEGSPRWVQDTGEAGGPGDGGEMSYRAGAWRRLTPLEAVYLAEHGRFPWPDRLPEDAPPMDSAGHLSPEEAERYASRAMTLAAANAFADRVRSWSWLSTLRGEPELGAAIRVMRTLISASAAHPKRCDLCAVVIAGARLEPCAEYQRLNRKLARSLAVVYYLVGEEPAPGIRELFRLG